MTPTRPGRHPSLDERHDPAIRIVDHDPVWAELAAEEIAAIEVALGEVAVRVDHVGSTAVPGLAAKPIVDLQVAVAALDPRAPYVEPLERLGYLFAADPDSSDLHFFGKPAARPRTFHVHVCAAGSDHERRHLALRDFLRAEPEEAARYGALKRELAGRHPGDRLAYIGGKAAYMEALEARATEWARNPRRVGDLLIRPGGAADEGVLFELFDEAMEWLVARGQTGQWGSEPWSQTQRGRDRVNGFAHDDGLWIAELGGVGVGALIVGKAPEWVPPPGRPELYVNLLITSRRRAGSNIGGRLLELAAERARAAGLPQLRVDCWAGSPRLVAYYEEQGFTKDGRFQVGDWTGQVLVRPLWSTPPLPGPESAVR